MCATPLNTSMKVSSFRSGLMCVGERRIGPSLEAIDLGQLILAALLAWGRYSEGRYENFDMGHRVIVIHREVEMLYPPALGQQVVRVEDR